MQSVRWRLKQNEIPIFCKLPKENKTNNKNVFTFLIYIFIFTLHAVLILFLFGLHFYKEALSFIIFILLLCSITLTLEAYLNTYVKNLKNSHFKISSWDEVFTRIFFFFSYRDEISSLSFWQGWVHPRMKVRLVKSITFITNFEPKKVFQF